MKYLVLLMGQGPDCHGFLFVNLQYSAKILELARKQRMNTDIRRNIFCVVMSSEDYLDAFEKLLRFVKFSSVYHSKLANGPHCIASSLWHLQRWLLR